MIAIRICGVLALCLLMTVIGMMAVVIGTTKACACAIYEMLSGK